MRDVAAAIIRKNGKILLARRAKGEKLQGYWEFPGGKVELGETIQQCLEREILEEFNVSIRTGEIICSANYIYEHGSFNIIAIEATLLSYDLRLTVHDCIEWSDPQSLLHYQLLPADVSIAEFLRN